MGRDSWDSAADWSGDAPRGRQPDPSPLPASRRSVEVVCCPHCQAVDVKKRDWRAGQPFAHWVCNGCGGSWKEAADVGGGGRRAALP